MRDIAIENARAIAEQYVQNELKFDYWRISSIELAPRAVGKGDRFLASVSLKFSGTTIDRMVSKFPPEEAVARREGLIGDFEVTLAIEGDRVVDDVWKDMDLFN